MPNIEISLKVEINIYSKNKMNKKDFQLMRTEIGLCQSIRDTHPSKFARLREMFSKHPSAGVGIIDLRAIRNPVWGGIDYSAVYANCESVISANECFYKNQSVNAHDMRKVKRAARTCIRDQVDAFRTHTACSCGSTLKLQVDHVRHFDDLITTFLAGGVPTKFDYTAGREPIFKEPLLSDWSEFHRVNSTFRMLCAACNNARPQWDKNL
jgi:hypothetical protein